MIYLNSDASLRVDVPIIVIKKLNEEWFFNENKP